jgi:hypothetical protein
MPDFAEVTVPGSQENFQKGLTSSGDGGTISVGNIERGNPQGRANAVYRFEEIGLNNRQQRILDALPEYDSRVIADKSDVSMPDLAALTAKTGVEYAMFTRGSERLIIRGNSTNVNIDVEAARKLAEVGYKWSGHTHIGDTGYAFSKGDYLILDAFKDKQKQSTIYDATGNHYEFYLDEGDE